ncbi:MAG: hypothetical protein ABWX68_08125 [Arthrobacter sp.]|uniref:hypothetical protein n=1 Tax=Arthrobacter sp. TaxID=1667 RepID=UPI003477ABF4
MNSRIGGLAMLVATSTLLGLDRLAASARALRRSERGDVPGWVMITLMTAVLVAALLAVAGPRLGDLFNQAIDRVSGLG